ncbi:MAG: hypothetical protein M0R20_03680 [Candidatus Omnitrophica bacterium]|jgi:hypothetical protein|nr:hypothetical protein [Candidatus Omnitrophota bacterium]
MEGFILPFVLVVLFSQILTAACAEPVSKDVITHTAKIIFFKNKTNNLTATIIPYTHEGSYPKSGWITCEIIDNCIAEIYSEKLKSKAQVEGFFLATYKKIGEDKNSMVLHYKGELLKIEPWNPPFLTK